VCTVTAVLIGSTGTIAEAQVACGDNIMDDRVMNADLVCMTNPALSLTGGKLDMAGHSVSCMGGNGVQIDGEGAELSNGAITGCAIGVVIGGVGKHKITNVTSQGNAADGFLVSGAVSGVKLTNCTAAGNAFDGVDFGGAGEKNKFAGVVATGNGGEGFDFVNSHNNKLSDCIASGNTGRGFLIVNGNGNKLSRNAAFNNNVNFTIDGNGNKLSQNTAGGGMLRGFDISGTENKLSKNYAVSNTQAGFSIFGTDNAVSKCTATSNGIDGLTINAGSTGTSIKGSRAINNAGVGIRVFAMGAMSALKGNTSLQNGIFDVADHNTDCGSNVWTDNLFGTSFDGGAACIQ
jgi:parallel beta-helix repeat protein